MKCSGADLSLHRRVMAKLRESDAINGYANCSRPYCPVCRSNTMDEWKDPRHHRDTACERHQNGDALSLKNWIRFGTRRRF
jgi:hypothetical protein